MRTDWLVVAGTIAAVALLITAGNRHTPSRRAQDQQPAQRLLLPASAALHAELVQPLPAATTRWDVTPLPTRSRVPTFNGYPCTVDCSGHEAGYEWAEEHGITDADDCDGNSESFIEGCQSYAEEHESISDMEASEEDEE
jgi:hypothetical protein